MTAVTPPPFYNPHIFPMTYNPAIHHRRSIRLRGYDYTQPGAYYVTLCVQDHQCIFGDVVNGEMQLNEFGHIVHEEWHHTAIVRHEITLDEFVIMPNHIHGIIIINDTIDVPLGATRRVAPTTNATITNGPVPRSIGAIVGQFKSIATKRINKLRGTNGVSLWQRDYYEHISRHSGDLNRIRQYIRNNPRKWQWDRENPRIR